MAYNHILLDIEDDVAAIRLNRPDRLNACSPEMADEIGAALDEAHRGATPARAVIITGAGRAFCSGADLQAGPASPIEGRDSHVSLTQHYNPLMVKLAALPIPVVTAVNGAAAGLGCSLALAGDFTLAADSAFFLPAWVNVGRMADGGSTWMLARLVGKARATEMLLLGERLSAAKAEQWGLIHRAVGDGELETEARALAQRLAQGPTIALGLIRRTIAQALESSYSATLALEAEAQVTARMSDDAKEGARAFAERRKPAFAGR